jgi:hypothetical protein
METQKLIMLAIDALELRRQSIIKEIGELETMRAQNGLRQVRLPAIGKIAVVAAPKCRPGSKKATWTPERRRKQSEAMKMAWQRRSERTRRAFRHRPSMIEGER